MGRFPHVPQRAVLSVGFPSPVPGNLCKLQGAGGPHAGAAHGHFLAHRGQTVLLAVAAQLPLEEHPALHDGHRVVAEVFHQRHSFPGAVLDEDAAGAETLGLRVRRGEVILHLSEPETAEGEK